MNPAPAWRLSPTAGTPISSDFLPSSRNPFTRAYTLLGNSSTPACFSPSAMQPHKLRAESAATAIAARIRRGRRGPEDRASMASGLLHVAAGEMLDVELHDAIGLLFAFGQRDDLLAELVDAALDLVEGFLAHGEQGRVDVAFFLGEHEQGVGGLDDPFAIQALHQIAHGRRGL